MVCIDRDAFKDPWDERDFIKRLKRQQIIATVIERKGAILGYCLYEQFSGYNLIRRMAVYVKHCGYGRQLLNDVKRQSIKNSKTFLDCRVPEENLEAQLFLAANGFTAIDVIPTDDGSQYLFRHLRGQR